MSQERERPPFAVTAFAVAMSLTAIVFGAIGLVTGEFWFPSKAKRAVSGLPGRVLGGLFLVAGTAGLIVSVIGAFGGETGRPVGRKIGRDRAARKPPSSRSQVDEEAAAEYLGLDVDDGPSAGG